LLPLNTAGFTAAAPPPEEVVGACGALLQPPKSSSALTFGLVSLVVAPKPPGLAPHPPVEAAAGAGIEGVEAGFASFQASLEDPQASKLVLRFAKDDV